jgi:hypothetical protein
MNNDVKAKNITDCDECPLHKKDCLGGLVSGGAGQPIEPPCTNWNQEDIIFEGMYDHE